MCMWLAITQEEEESQVYYKINRAVQVGQVEKNMVN